jgi:condensin complex subunit 3
LARVFVEHCKDKNDEARLEAALPVVTALAFRIQEAYNNLMEFLREIEEDRLVQEFDEAKEQQVEDDRNERELIIGEMLKLAVSLDYSDEIGRRKMFQLVRKCFVLHL